MEKPPICMLLSCSPSSVRMTSLVIANCNLMLPIFLLLQVRNALATLRNLESSTQNGSTFVKVDAQALATTSLYPGILTQNDSNRNRRLALEVASNYRRSG
jgi:hypothetical protein